MQRNINPEGDPNVFSFLFIHFCWLLEGRFFLFFKRQFTEIYFSKNNLWKNIEWWSSCCFFLFLHFRFRCAKVAVPSAECCLMSKKRKKEEKDTVAKNILKKYPKSHRIEITWQSQKLQNMDKLSFCMEKLCYYDIVAGTVNNARGIFLSYGEILDWMQKLLISFEKFVHFCENLVHFVWKNCSKFFFVCGEKMTNTALRFIF